MKTITRNKDNHTRDASQKERSGNKKRFKRNSQERDFGMRRIFTELIDYRRLFDHFLSRRTSVFMPTIRTTVFRVELEKIQSNQTWIWASEWEISLSVWWTKWLSLDLVYHQRNIRDPVDSWELRARSPKFTSKYYIIFHGARAIAEERLQRTAESPFSPRSVRVCAHCTSLGHRAARFPFLFVLPLLFTSFSCGLQPLY